MKKLLFIFLFSVIFIASGLSQQMGSAVNHFLDFPVSAHSAALGGRNVSHSDIDPMFAYSNPGLLTVESDNELYMNGALYMVTTGYVSAAYSMKFSDKDAFMVGTQFAHYGNMQGYDEAGKPTGNFSAQDIAVNVNYSRNLNKYFTIGASVKPILSVYETYTSFSLGVDLGIALRDTAHLVSAGLSITNFGGKLAGPTDVLMQGNWLPMNVSIGVSKRFKKAPFALHLTLQNLQKWDYNYATSSNSNETGVVSVGNAIARKIILGVDIVPKSDKFWIALSYNFDRGLSLGNEYVFSLSGLSGGFGLNMKNFKLGAAVAFYNTAAVTAHITLALKLNSFEKKKL